MGQNVPLCDSPYSLPHLIVARLLDEVLRYICSDGEGEMTLQHSATTPSDLESEHTD